MKKYWYRISREATSANWIQGLPPLTFLKQFRFGALGWNLNYSPDYFGGASSIWSSPAPSLRH